MALSFPHHMQAGAPSKGEIRIIFMQWLWGPCSLYGDERFRDLDQYAVVAQHHVVGIAHQVLSKYVSSLPRWNRTVNNLLDLMTCEARLFDVENSDASHELSLQLSEMGRFSPLYTGTHLVASSRPPFPCVLHCDGSHSFFEGDCFTELKLPLNPDPNNGMFMVVV